MKKYFLLLFALLFMVAPIFAEELAKYRETIEQISSWSKEEGLITYKGANRTLKAFANAHNTAIKNVEREKAKIAKAKSDYATATSAVRFSPSTLIGKINKPILGNGRDAIVAREQIKRDGAIKRAERAINSANRQKIESQKLALQDLRRKLKNEKFPEEAEKEEQKKLMESISELIDGLVLPEKP